MALLFTAIYLPLPGSSCETTPASSKLHGATSPVTHSSLLLHRGHDLCRLMQVNRAQTAVSAICTFNTSSTLHYRTTAIFTRKIQSWTVLSIHSVHMTPITNKWVKWVISSYIMILLKGSRCWNVFINIKITFKGSSPCSWDLSGNALC